MSKETPPEEFVMARAADGAMHVYLYLDDGLDDRNALCGQENCGAKDAGDDETMVCVPCLEEMEAWFPGINRALETQRP